MRAQPRQRPDSERHQRPDTSGQQSGDQQHPEPGAADRCRLDQDHRRDQRGGEDERHRGDTPGGDDQHQALRRRVAASQADHQPSDSSPQHDQRSLRAEHQPKADRRQAREDHSRHDVRARGAAGRQALGGDMSTVAREAGDRHRHNQRTDGEDWKRPPLRRAALIADRMRQVYVQLLLDLERRLEKAPGRDRNDHANDRDHYQQSDERLAAHRRVSLLGGQLWRSTGVGHTLGRYGRTRT